MEWPFPFCWAAAFNAPVGPMTWYGWPGPLPGEPAVEDGFVGLTALDIELIRLVSEVLVESVNCTICGAQLDRAVNVQLRRGYFNAAGIVIATHCRGWRRHRHMARVVETAGHLYFGQLRPN